MTAFGLADAATNGHRPADIQEPAESAPATYVPGGLSAALTESAALFDASPVLRHVRRFAAARGAGELATLGNVLARAALAVPHPVTLPPIVGGPVSLNTLLVVAGVSGAGKDIAHAAAEAAVVLTRANGAAVRWEPHPVGTGEGIGRTFATGQKDPVTGTAATVFHRRSALFVVRDIAAFDALGERRGQTLVPELLKAAMGQELGHANATVEHRVILPPHSYRLALSAGVQPGNGSSLLSERSIRDGLTQRFLWLPVRDGRRREAVREPDPLRIAVPDFGVTSDPLDDDTEPPALVHLDVAEQIRREIVAVNDEKDLDPFGSSGDPLAGHRLLAQLKAAAALAVLHGRTGVDMETWQWGGALIAISDAVTAEVAARSSEAAARDAAQRGELDGHRQSAADSTRESASVEAVAQRIAGFLKTDRWTNEGDITRKFSAQRRRFIAPALSLLTERGEVQEDLYVYKEGRDPIMRYRLQFGV
ncbi:hypothetical protein C5E43_27660 [Nocardia cyriacigeorgica]|nr:hypothetical protein C5B73_27530 [Nocardia cyriacigeorgica]PPJ01923.1 hypothetical protein C5E43_27660 [Nocardia cyriacigeorgica]